MEKKNMLSCIYMFSPYGKPTKTDFRFFRFNANYYFFNYYLGHLKIHAENKDIIRIKLRIKSAEKEQGFEYLYKVSIHKNFIHWLQ